MTCSVQVEQAVQTIVIVSQGSPESRGNCRGPGFAQEVTSQKPVSRPESHNCHLSVQSYTKPRSAKIPAHRGPNILAFLGRERAKTFWCTGRIDRDALGAGRGCCRGVVFGRSRLGSWCANVCHRSIGQSCLAGSTSAECYRSVTVLMQLPLGVSAICSLCCNRTMMMAS